MRTPCSCCNTMFPYVLIQPPHFTIVLIRCLNCAIFVYQLLVCLHKPPPYVNYYSHPPPFFAFCISSHIYTHLHTSHIHILHIHLTYPPPLLLPHWCIFHAPAWTFTPLISCHAHPPTIPDDPIHITHIKSQSYFVITGFCLRIWIDLLGFNLVKLST